MKKIDLRGMECPHPFIKAVEEYSKLSQGETLEIIMTSKRCVELLQEAIGDAWKDSVWISEEEPGVYIIRVTKKYPAKIKDPSKNSC